MENKISIIIPVYNTREYLEDCLNSVLKQNLNNLEVIIINDASTDGSLKICEDYSKSYGFILISNEENLGLARTRNKGLDISSGEYVIFLDSDDILPPNSISTLYEAIKKEDADIAMAKLNSFNSLGEYGYYSDKYMKKYEVSNIYQNKDIVNCISVCSKIYKKEFIKDLRFLEGTTHEDNSFTLKAYFKPSKIVIIPQYLYYRRIREGKKESIMQNLNYNTFSDLIRNYKEVINNLDNSLDLSFLYKYMITQLCNYVVKSINKDEMKNAKENIKSFINYIYNVSYNKKENKFLKTYYGIYGGIVFLFKGVIKSVKK